MRDHERAMLAYALLSGLSWQKGQYLSRNKFLILTASAACRAGWPDVANRCHVLVLANNPLHLLGNYDLFTDALCSHDFEPFLKQLERFCGYEKAEHLLSELEIEPIVPNEELEMTPGDFVLKILADEL